jgi:hypothetical protein
MGDERHSFLIILCGKIKIYNRELVYKKIYKICYPGETVGEELIFLDSCKNAVN